MYTKKIFKKSKIVQNGFKQNPKIWENPKNLKKILLFILFIFFLNFFLPRKYAILLFPILGGCDLTRAFNEINEEIISLMVFKMIYCLYQDSTRYMRSNIHLCPQEFPQASLLGTPSGEEVFLTVYTLPGSNTDTRHLVLKICETIRSDIRSGI